MPEFAFKTEEIARLIHLVETRNLAELIVEEEGTRVVIRGANYPVFRAQPGQVWANQGTYEEVIASSAALFSNRPVEDEDSGSGLEDRSKADQRIPIATPMVGVFYRAARPDAPPLVEVGDRVEVGQVIGLIEAMKVFSEIPSEHAGVVLEIVAQNGQLVQTGQPLLYLAPE